MRRVYPWFDLLVVCYGTPPRPDLPLLMYTPPGSIDEDKNDDNNHDANTHAIKDHDAKDHDSNHHDAIYKDANNQNADHDDANNKSGNNHEANNKNGNKHGANDPADNSQVANNGDVDDNTMVASWLNALTTTAQNDPYSIYSSCTSPEFVKWCLNIFRMGQYFSIPGLTKMLAFNLDLHWIGLGWGGVCIVTTANSHNYAESIRIPDPDAQLEDEESEMILFMDRMYPE